MSLRVDKQELKDSFENLVKEKLINDQALKKYLELEICKFFIHIKEFDLGIMDRFDLTVKEIGEPTKELIERSPPQPHINSNNLNIMATLYASFSFTETRITGVIDGNVNFPLPGLAHFNQTTVFIRGLDFEGIFKISIINGFFMIWLDSEGLRLEPKFKIEFEHYGQLDTSPLENYLLGMMKRKLVNNSLLFNVPLEDLFGKNKSF